ncbi:MAG: AAA family ATPase, partial [Planctomycetota bacterium]
ERGMSSLIHALGARLQLSRRSLMSVQQRAIMDHLRGTDRLILLDECQHLKRDSLDVLRDIHDEAEVPIILCGTHDLVDLVTDARAFYGQFTSRVVAREDLARIVGNDDAGDGGGSQLGRKLFTVDEVKQIFEAAKLKLTEEAWDLLTNVANSPADGALRSCRKTVELLVGAGYHKKPKVTDKMILGSLRSRHPELYRRIDALHRNSKTVRATAEAVA